MAEGEFFSHLLNEEAPPMHGAQEEYLKDHQEPEQFQLKIK